MSHVERQGIEDDLFLTCFLVRGSPLYASCLLIGGLILLIRPCIPFFHVINLNQPSAMHTSYFYTATLFLACKKYTKKCINSRQNSQNWGKIGFLLAKKYTGLKKSTPPPVVTVVINISYECPPARAKNYKPIEY